MKGLGIDIDVVAGSVTDSQMGEDFVQNEFGINAGNARRDGLRLFELIKSAERKKLNSVDINQKSLKASNLIASGETEARNATEFSTLKVSNFQCF